MKLILKLIKLFVGLFVGAFGIIMTINANVGLPPWDVLHNGVKMVLNIEQMGDAVILVNFVLTGVAMLLGEKVGIGTLANMFILGKFMNLISIMNIIPKAQNSIIGFIMLNVGMIIFAIGTVIYISCGLGCGSKDGVTMALNRITNKPVKIIRASLEVTAIIIGLVMARSFSSFSIGTIYSALVFGFLMQACFKILKCNAAELKHISIRDMFSIKSATI